MINSELVCLLKASKEHREEEYEKILGHIGFTVVYLPVLSFNFVNTEKLWSCLQNPLDYNGLIFTSQRAVESTKNALKSNEKEWLQKLQNQWNASPVFVVGKSTGCLTNALLGLKITGEDSGNAEALLPKILQVIPPKIKPLLFPCGNLTIETLPEGLTAADIAFKTVTVYNTEIHPDFEVSLEHLLISKGIPQFFVFFSPSGVNYSHKTFKNVIIPFQGVKYIAIGPSTRQALEKNGFQVSATAQHPTPESLSEAIKNLSL